MKIGPFIVSVRWVGFSSHWKKLAREGKKIDAIKALREKRSSRAGLFPLIEAKNIVEAYLLKLK